MFTPDLSPMTTVIKIKKRQEALVNGAPKVTFTDANPALDCCNWKSLTRRSGDVTERDGLLTYSDTVYIVMYYRPDLSAKDRVILVDTGQEYEIVSAPENIGNRYQYMMFTVQRVGVV